MERKVVFNSIKPFLIGLGVAAMLYYLTHWWAFWVIFPWIGFSVGLGIFLRKILKGKKKILGRKVAIIMVLPVLLLFVPIYNNENFQLEGIVLIVSVGFLSKGFIHYAVAKIFGPLIWRRGFCSYACWTAAILDWLPIRKETNELPRSARNLRYIALLISLALPLYLVFVLSFDPYNQYIYKTELQWMIFSNIIYYAIGIPLAFILHDRRAFCKYVCPVALVTKPASYISVIKIKAVQEKECIECGACNKICPMGVDVMSYMKNKKPIRDTECILCSDCKIVCPTKIIV